MNDLIKRQPIRNYKNWLVWQTAMELARQVYLLTGHRSDQHQDPCRQGGKSG
jgi:hypothetical protein